MKQHTIKQPVDLSGIGLHSGQVVKVTFLPAPINHGIKFQRVDLEPNIIISADVSKVVSTNRSTVVQNGIAAVGTIEHALSALAGLKIDNILIEINAAEMPIIDGSSKPFIKALEFAGIKEQDAERVYFVVEHPIAYSDPETGAELLVLPSDEFQITATIDFNSPVLGPQFAKLDNLDDYKDQIAPCRTFVFTHELEQLMDMGLIKGGDLDNAIVIANQAISKKYLNRLAKKIGLKSIEVGSSGVLNTTKLQFQNEPARHKLLDIIGDLNLIGVPIKGRIVAHKPGHTVNVAFARVLKIEFEKQQKLKRKPKYDVNDTPVFDTVAIESMLPHRYPFLLVDKIVELSKKKAVGVKNITMNEWFFQGHYPNNPIFPEVLQIEALIQTGIIFVLSQVPDPENWNTNFLKIDKTKFKHKVVPGDTIILKMELIAPVRRGICQMQGTAYVGNKIVSEGELTAQIIRRTVDDKS